MLHTNKKVCFVKCIIFLTGEDYKKHYLDFIRKEKRRSNIMTMAKVQPFCRANNIRLGYWDGTRVFPRSVTTRDSALFLYKNHFCLIWKSEGVSFDSVIKNELKDSFKVANKYISEENVKSIFEYKYIPKKLGMYQKRIETGYAFTKDMNDELVDKFNNQTFTQGSAILKVKFYNPKNLIVQHLPLKEKVKKIEVN